MKPNPDCGLCDGEGAYAWEGEVHICPCTDEPEDWEYGETEIIEDED